MPDTRTPETTPSNDAYTFGRLPRLTSWWAIAAVLSALVLLIAPGQLPVTLYKLNLIALAAVAGYWIDRAIFPYARPQLDALSDLTQPQQPMHCQQGDEECLLYLSDHSRLYFLAAVMLRRALIVAATVLAVALGA
ncbi:putative holin [Vandammella animalimorsus]|uniref:Uncharacterized protein n=1 Tax=Vandammella animalimorsus TaxID=2029117 RepID=A0A2A2A772_9BURK|nr:putative holin [Vandammella animalimorsus]PAT32883.1 hypothetical protein CK620_13500 [Vandammella animalimorsus]